MQPVYIFVTGGVISGIGKGIVTSSAAKILQSRGYKVTAVKIDPYLNLDAGTMNPTEHGEVFVTFDGGEIDQDLGNYERFLNIKIPKSHNITSGSAYESVLRGERKGVYLGKTVEAIPHITDEIKRRIREARKESNAEITLVEIGGTVGEWQSELFYRAATMMKDEGEKALFIHVPYIPIPTHLGEPKTKPAQQSIEELGKYGIKPDFVVCRSEDPIDDVRKNKINTICGIKKDHIISSPNVDCIYDVPLLFEEQDLGNKILKSLGMEEREKDLNDWREMVENAKTVKDPIRVGIVGKYFNTGDHTLGDTYISVIEAVKHAAWKNKMKPIIEWINCEECEKDPSVLNNLENYDGIIIPGGFGNRGIEGKILNIKYARENDIPLLGLCLGLQTFVIEYARNVCGLTGANSTEVDKKTPYPVIDIMPEQIGVTEKGATMRLGEYPAVLRTGTKVWKMYGRKKIVKERHRHRFEVNPEFHGILQDNGMVFSGMSPDGRLVEFAELEDHLFLETTQAHPEFTSSPLSPNPMFNGFIKACKIKAKAR